MLSSLKTVTATPRGLACGTSSSSFILGLAVGRRVVFPPLQSVLSPPAGRVCGDNMDGQDGRRTDNMAVVSHINRQGGSRSCTLDRLARRLLLWSQDKFLSLRAVHIPGIVNLADDFLSRQKLRPGECMLNRQTVSPIWDLFGEAKVDLFSSQESSQCPLWFSLSFPTTLGIDAFAHPWPNVRLYAFPPIKLIPAVLCRVKVSSARLLLIAPFWPSQTWFSELTPLLYRPPWEIPIRWDLLSQLQGKIWHPQPELWKLWVWPYRAKGCD